MPMPPVLAPRTSFADGARWAKQAFPVRDALFLVAFAAVYAAAYIYGNRIPAPAPIWLPDAVLVGVLLKAFIAVLLLRRFDGHALHFDSLRAIGIYIACAVVAAPAISALIGAAGRVTLGEQYWAAWIVWFLGDALACLLLAPA